MDPQQHDQNEISRTQNLDGTAVAPRQPRDQEWYLCDECFLAIYEEKYKPFLTPQEAWRLMGYEHKAVREYYSKGRLGYLSDEEWDDKFILMEKWLKGMNDEWDARKKAHNKTHVNHELGPREFTLTYSPAWGWSDSDARSMMQLAIERLCRYYADDIVELHARGEVGKNGLSHIHCYYELKGGLKMTDKNFKRAYPRWNPAKKTSKKGFEGGHHETVKVTADFKGYMEKEEENWFKHDVNKSET